VSGYLGDLSSQVRYSGNSTRSASACDGSKGVISSFSNPSVANRLTSVMYFNFRNKVCTKYADGYPVQNDRGRGVIEQFQRNASRDRHRAVGQPHQFGCLADADLDWQSAGIDHLPGDLGLSGWNAASANRTAGACW